MSIHGFRDLVPVLKMYGCYLDMKKFRATFYSHPSNTRRLHFVDVNKPPQKFVKRVYTMCTDSNCMICQFVCCLQMI